VPVTGTARNLERSTSWRPRDSVRLGWISALSWREFTAAAWSSHVGDECWLLCRLIVCGPDDVAWMEAVVVAQTDEVAGTAEEPAGFDARTFPAFGLPLTWTGPELTQ
jgi:hypothetical protein